MGEKFQRLYSGALLCSTHLKITVICCQCNTATTSAVVSLMARKVDKEDGAVFKFTLGILLPNVEGPRRQLLAFASPALAACGVRFFGQLVVPAKSWGGTFTVIQ